MSRKFNITVNGQAYDVTVDEVGAAPVATTSTVAAPVAPAPAPAAKPAVNVEGTKVTAPMPGNINGVSVKVGDAVKNGDKLIVLEAMKMENDITSPTDGTVAAVAVNKGDVVSTGDLLVVIG